MKTRLVLRIEREGKLLGSWSLQDSPLEMSMVDLGTGKIVARFTASAEALAMVDNTDQLPAPPPRAPRPESVDELPVPGVRLDGDDFTMPLPEPTEDADELPVTEERPRRSRTFTPNLARARSRAGDGLTSELQLVDDDDGDGLTSELVDDDHQGMLHDELPVDAADDQAGLTSELRTATMDLPPTRRRQPIEDGPSLTARMEHLRPEREATSGQTPRALISPPPQPRVEPQPAEVWSQKRGEWRSIGHLVPGQRVSTLGGWVRLAPDGRLVVRSGRNLAGTATLVDGRMIEIETSEDYLALPPGSSVMLAVGDRGIYVRSEPLPADLAEVRMH